MAKIEENQKKESQKENKCLFYKKWWFWLIVAIAAIAIIASIGGGGPSDLIDLPEDEYRSACQVYTYDEIARTPDKYEKKLAKFTGKVIQVMRNENELQLRVNVTEGKYTYEDTVYVFYTLENGVNVLEGDIITMYGELRGMIEYESVLGAKITIPRIYAKFIDVEK